MTVYGQQSIADRDYAGKATYPRYNKDGIPARGLQIDYPIYQSLGTPALADTDSLVDAATGAELPNATTTTYVFATDGGVTPLDGVDSDGVLDVARNIVSSVSHGSAVVAMTIVYTGLDAYGETISETHSITAGGTSKVVNGLKAFKSLTSIAITTAGNATTNTLNVGFGDVLGLPFRVDSKNRVLTMFDGQPDAATVVIADDNNATATSGDVRGTVNLNGTLDGSKEVSIWIMPERDTKANAFGVTQYSG